MWDNITDSKLTELIPEDRVLKDEPMYIHTTFRVGGKAKRYLAVRDEDELIGLFKILDETGAVYSDKAGGQSENPSYYVIGNGSNILVSDEGFDGLIIDTSDMNEISAQGDIITAQAGVLLGRLASAALEHSLKGLEFASGIPGTLGGAVYMNAGAYGGEMKDVIESVTVYDREAGEVRTLKNEEMDFSYRHSAVKDRPYTVLSATVRLSEGEHDEIEALMKDLNGRRREKQPLEYPSAGSTFKRPEGFFAGGLIEECGLKGYTVGGAAVSDKHAGFVINKDKATAADIYRLICEVREKVYADTGVRLEPEVVFLGEF